MDDYYDDDMFESEFADNFDDENQEYDLKEIENFEKIPENVFPVKVTKQEKKMDEMFNPKPMHQSIPRQQAKMVRPINPEPKQQLTYDDILSKMGMYVANGQLHLKTGIQNHAPSQKSAIKQEIKSDFVPDVSQQNSYIYNKYFKDSLVKEDNVRVPRNAIEYRNMLINDIVQRARINKIKSKKMMLSNSNIVSSVAQKDLNKLFSFSQR
jgi:hypothetical protein